VAEALDGQVIDGAAGFREYLLSRDDELVTTLARKLLEYALGRGLEYYDGPAVRQLLRRSAAQDHRWSSLIVGIVESPPFQMRRTAAPGESNP
jgi:hypothetical protein